MSTTVRNVRPRTPMDRDRKTALVAGVLYLITFAGSLPALPLYHDILHDHRYILGNASGTGVRVSALLELICALAGIGTAVVLFRVVKRYSEALALGFIAARVFEAAMIGVGVISVLSIVTLQHDSAGGSAADANSLVTAGRSLVALHDWTFLLGPGFMPAVSALCLGTVLYRSRLVPRVIPMLGLIGAPLLAASGVATLFGGYDQLSAMGAAAGFPIAAWELSLGVWLVVKGFKPTAIAASADPSTVGDREAELTPAVA
ncbi:MAG: hypothetical protein JWL73_2558 [Actinomycetia bacterium]|nr:hypothetical protein [Actinomycetes bacterium]